jgi:hypothetical protein
MENNNPENVAAFEVFNNTEDLAASMNQEQAVAEPVAEQPTESVEQPVVEEAPQQFEQSAQEVQQPIEEAPQPEPEYSEADLEQAVMSFMSERLGREINSLDDFSVQQETNAIDERVEAIARFVEETGRAPEDWFRFQSLNPEGMDDMTAIRIQMSNEYPNLSYDELNLLVNSKYKVDADLYSEEEVNLAKLQMKMDGDKARQSIEDIRQGYAAPEYESEASQSVIDEQWISNMVDEVETLEGLEFDLGDGNLFEFGLDDNYKDQLMDKQARLDEFFDPYVREDGSWDYDLLSSHMAVIDNIDRIVKSAYTRGLGDGQRTLVDTASNVSTQTAPQGNQNQQTDPLTEQLKNIMTGSAGRMTFKI